MYEMRLINVINYNLIQYKQWQGQYPTIQYPIKHFVVF